MRAALVALVCASACAPRSAAPPSVAAWGIEAVSLRPTLGGAMLDFRFKVVDADKARPLFDRKLQPYLFDRARGVALGMADDGKLGALRASLRNPPVAGKHYYVMFANGYGTVRRGDEVSVGIGKCKLEHVVVE